MMRAGYTVVEIMMAATVIGIVAAASVGYYATGIERTRWDQARNVLRDIYNGEQVYFNLKGGKSAYYPPTSWGICPADVPVMAGWVCLGVCGPASVTCRSGWRDEVHTDNPNGDGGGPVVYRVEAPFPVPNRFLATAIYRRLSGAVSININETGQLCAATAPACTWTRP
jgi:prepilin-type N-terminal cleavage/methylation domain-containing protein